MDIESLVELGFPVSLFFSFLGPGNREKVKCCRINALELVFMLVSGFVRSGRLETSFILCARCSLAAGFRFKQLNRFTSLGMSMREAGRRMNLA